jgi:hypothetical protein
MSVLEIDRFLTNPPKNRIKFVGIELEGGWTKYPPGEEVNFHGDASVKGLGSADVNGNPIKSGEIVSPPMEPAAMGKWVTRWYPQALNATCGLHIHMSFHQIRHYKRLMVSEYQDTMIEYLKRWAEAEGTFPHEKPCELVHNPFDYVPCSKCGGLRQVPGHHIWDRLAGKNKNCNLKFWPDKQVQMSRHGDQSSPDRFYRDGSRYTVINYCFGIENRQTLEVRVLPMMEKPEQAVRALKHVVRITNAVLYVLRNDARQDRISFSVPNVDLGSPIIDEEILVL